MKKIKPDYMTTINELLNFGQLLNLIKYPLSTEKAINLYSLRQYTFIVDRKITKKQIKYVLEKFFEVKILGINTCLLPVKTRRVGKFLGKESSYKKAIITLQEGDKIANLIQ
jgi:large subunit ribosomal protein L23